MKVAYLLGSLNRGGAESLVLDVCMNAEHAPFEMVLIHRKSGSMQSDFYKTGVRCVRCKHNLSNPIRYVMELRRILKEEKVDVVHSQQRIDTFFAHYATLGTDVKVVDTFHGFDTGYRWRERLLVRLSKRWSDALVFVSHYEAEHYAKKYDIPSRKVHMVYNGISFDKFDKVDAVSDLPRQNPNSIRMAMVGNFGPGRDHLTICRFLKLLHEKDVCFDFYFVGRKNVDTPYLYDDCVAYCSENNLLGCVHFMGQRADVPVLLKQMDAFVYSTVHDTFGIAVIEAMAVGLPVFVNDWAVMKELCEDGKLATLYESRNERDLFEKFLVFSKNMDEYKNKARECAAIVRKKYCIQRHVDELNVVYELVI